jgi:hypothetical protein
MRRPVEQPAWPSAHTHPLVVHRRLLVLLLLHAHAAAAAAAAATHSWSLPERVADVHLHIDRCRRELGVWRGVWRVWHERTFLPIKGMVPIRLTAAAVSGLAKVTNPYLGVHMMSSANECLGRGV